MGDMKDLYTEGVTDLNSYNIGVTAGIEQVLEVIRNQMKTNGDVLKRMSGYVAFDLFQRIIRASEESDDE